MLAMSCWEEVSVYYRLAESNTYNFLLRHGSEARVLRPSLAAFGSSVLHIVRRAVGEIAWVVVAGHVDESF